MNKVLYVVALVTLLALALAGVALAQDSSKINPEDIYGSGQKTWQLKEYVLDGKAVTLPDFALDDRITFTSAGLGKFDAGTIFKDASMPLADDAFLWSIEGDRLILSDFESLHPTGKVEQRIVRLTPDEMVLERDYDQDGKTVVLSQTWVPAPSVVTATQVITYSPEAVPAGDAQAGSCWTNSLAASGREDAWRCTVENAIYDPCFQIAGNNDVVVCSPDPTKNDPGIAMKLTEPLPKPDVPQAAIDAYKNNGWLVQLADGNYCGFMTGATFGLGADRANYGCTDGQWYIMGDLQPGTVWKAKMATVTIGDNGAELKESKTADVRTVWR